MDASEVAHGGVLHVGRYRIPYLAIERAAEAINLPGQTRFDFQDRAAQCLALDEVVWKLVERTVKIVVEANIAFEHADEDLPFAFVIAVEGKAGALADHDALVDR